MHKKVITSSSNPRIKEIKELLKKKSARNSKGKFIVEGLRGVKEIPTNKVTIETLVVGNKISEELYKDIHCKEILEVDSKILDDVTDTINSQGILAIVAKPNVSLENIDTTGNILILENLQDPGNLGTIIRSAHAFNFKSVLLTKGTVDLYSPKVVRATMSSLFYVDVVTDHEISEYIEYLKQKDIKIYVTALKDDAKSIKDIEFDKNQALIIGNEGNGVSDYCLNNSDCAMIIPMPGAAESLNASIAASICMYEISK